jgi:hypothetical protein
MLIVAVYWSSDGTLSTTPGSTKGMLRTAGRLPATSPANVSKAVVPVSYSSAVPAPGISTSCLLCVPEVVIQLSIADCAFAETFGAIA